MTANVLIDNPPHMGTLEAGMLSSGASMGGGLMLWLGANATAIGILVTIASLILTVLFFYLNVRVNIRGQDIRRAEIEREVILDLLDKANEEEKKILSRLLSGD